MARDLCHPHLPLPDRLLSLARPFQKRGHPGQSRPFCTDFTTLTRCTEGPRESRRTVVGAGKLGHGAVGDFMGTPSDARVCTADPC